MKLDNTKAIKRLLNFDIEGTFFMVQVMIRRKDQPDPESFKSDNIILKDYFIKSEKDFDNKIGEIKKLCDAFIARAYIRLNRCFFDKVAFENLSIIAEYLQKGDFHSVKSSFATACGRRCYDPEKKWVIDIDFFGAQVDDEILMYHIQSAKSGYENNIIAKIPTLNGYHLITRPFDTREFIENFPDIDLHKNNPTVLYA